MDEGARSKKVRICSFSRKNSYKFLATLTFFSLQSNADFWSFVINRPGASWYPHAVLVLGSRYSCPLA